MTLITTCIVRGCDRQVPELPERYGVICRSCWEDGWRYDFRDNRLHAVMESGGEKPTTSDPVNHPPHYNTGKIEVIEAIEDWKLCYHLGSVVKYTARAGRKDPTKTIEDLKKAVWYLNRKIELLESKNEKRDPRRPNDMGRSKEKQNEKMDASACAQSDGGHENVQGELFRTIESVIEPAQRPYAERHPYTECHPNSSACPCRICTGFPERIGSS